MFCKMLETEKIQRINQQLEEINYKIKINPWRGEKSLKKLKELCSERTRLVALLNYLQK